MRLDIVDIKKAVKNGDILISVHNDNILLTDTITEESVCIGNIIDLEKKMGKIKKCG